MPDSHINVFTLGLGGVNVDADPILTEDNQTLKSQNATYDPTVARAGALTKRMGLDRFNSVPMTGPVLGGIEAPFAGTAGAPAAGGGGGGDAGDSGGTTDGQPATSGSSGSGGYGVGPGSNIIGSAGSSGASGGAGQGAAFFNGGTPLFGGKKLIVVGMNDGSTGTGWYVTSKGFNDPVVTVNSATPPHVPSRLDRLTAAAQVRYVLGQTANHDQVIGFPQSVTEGLCARPNGVLFYPQSINPAESTGYPGGSASGCASPIIRRNDGRTDIAIGAIPPAGWPTQIVTGSIRYSTGHGMQIVGMGTKYGDGSKIYICVHDLLGVGGVTITNDGFRLLRLDTTSYALTTIFNSVSSLVPSPNYNAMTGTASPFLSGGGFEAWFGGVNGATGVSSSVFGLVPSPGFGVGYANWKGFEGAFAANGDVTCMAIYRGDLYVGHSNLDATPAYAVINALPIASTSLPGNPVFTASDSGTAQANNGFVSMAIFQGNLYVSYFNAGVSARIFKFDGTTWSVAFTVASGTKAPMNLQVDSDGDILYAFGTSSAIATPAWYTTSDGATWTSKATNMNVSNRFPMNIFADFNQ